MKPRSVLLLQSSVVADRYRGIREYAHAHDWHLHVVICNGVLPEGWRGDGILVCAEETPEILRFLKRQSRRGMPIVELAEHLTRIDLPRISIDNRKLGEIAAAYFLRHRFAHAAWFSYGWSQVHERREQSFRRALGADVTYERLCWQTESKPSGFFDAVAFDRWLGERLSRMPKPLCVFCYNDADAVHVIETCAACALRVPDEIAVLGVDDERLVCDTSPVPISSIRHNFRQVGLKGAALLDGLIGGNTPSHRTVYMLPDGIAERKSTDTLGIENTLLKKVFGFIDRNLATPIGAEQIGEFLGLSRNDVYRLFAHELGRSVGDEILRRRLKAAARLLTDGSASVQDVAKRCGFCNASYFIRKFHAATGQTPNTFAKATSHRN